jgi:arsenate reductase
VTTAGVRAILFLCTGDSCRSQMAEGWHRHLGGDRYEALSAGTAPKPVHPLAVRAMREAGVDISGQRSKSVADLPGIPLDTVITVCDRARQSCPVFPGAAATLHRSFDDPAEA